MSVEQVVLPVLVNAPKSVKPLAWKVTRPFATACAESFLAEPSDSDRLDTNKELVDAPLVTGMEIVTGTLQDRARSA